MTLSWKTSFTEKQCRIFRDKIIVGLLKTSIWRGSAYGELNGHMLTFKPLGVWKKSVQILDIEGKKELGKIEFNLWKSSALITYEQIQYEWNYKSWTRKSWDVRGPDESASFLRSGFWRNEGNINYDDIPAAIILIALYVHGYFSRMAAAT